MAEKIYVTLEGKKKLEDELHELVTVKRLEIAENIKTARGFGDLSENSEYDEAKNEQAVVEARIKELEEKLKVIEVVDKSSASSKVISLGSKAIIKYLDNGEEVEYTIVGSAECDLLENKISSDSPLGKALVGSKAGKTVTVEAPAGTFEVKILKVSN